MRGELVRIEAEDGLELVGFYAAPEGGASTAVLHVHGLAGNFYENRFVDAVSRDVLARGAGFLSVNNRGHEYRSDNLLGDGAETISALGGASWEVFEESAHDVGGCARYLASRGHERIVFEGHSLGCNKIVHYLVSRSVPEAAGVVLLAPPDIYGLRDRGADGGLSEVLREARALVAAGAGETEMASAGYVVPISAATVVGMYGDPGASDIFPFRLGSAAAFPHLEEIALPVLVVYGSVDEAAVVPVDEAVAALEGALAASPRVEAVVIEGGNHVYWGFEGRVGRAVGGFVGSLLDGEPSS